MRKLPYVLFFILIVIGLYYLYTVLFIRNLSIKANVEDVQVRFRKLDNPKRSFESEIFNVKEYSVLGRTPLDIDLEPGKYLIILSKSGHIPVLDEISINDNSVSKSYFLEPGFRFVNGKVFEDSRGNTHNIKSFFLAEKEITNRQYLQFCEATGHRLPIYNDDPRFNGKDQPVIGINFEDAIAYTKWRSEITGLNVRLPYEYEWEFAASNGDNSRIYPWGIHETTTSSYLANYHPFDVIQQKLLNKDVDGYEYTAPVGSYPRTDKKFYDLAGNVFEWCLDDVNIDYNKDYNLDIELIPFSRVVKGGSWNFNQLFLTIKNRIYVDGRIAKGYNGIRLLIELN